MNNKNIYIKDNLYSNKNINVHKHNVPSSREWTDSVYSYNKNFLKDLPQKDNYLYNLIKTYLHMIPIIKTSTKSKRLRDSLSRNSSKQTFISKPEIKQTSDNINIVLYLYNREAKINNKKAFYFNNMLNSIINNTLYNNDIEILHKNRFKRRINRVKRASNKFDAKYYKHDISIYKSIVSSRNIMNNIFLYNFLKWSLSGFGYKISINKYSNSYILYIINSKYGYNKSYMLSGKNLSIFNLLHINKLLTTYLYMSCNSINKQNIISVMLNYYTNKYMDKYLNKYMKKQYISLRNIFKLQINKLKLGKIVIGLKSLIHNIYNKKVELNIVNLKYLHLNSDILTEAIGVKLRNKNNSVLSIFKKAMSLVKIPKISSNKNIFNSMNLIDKFKLFNINNVTNNKYINIKKQDMLSTIIHSIFPYRSLNFISKSNNSSISNLLNSLYYKWVTGIRLEGKGRLTRRFTASRSLFKYKYRGSLKSLEHLNVPYYRKDSLNSVMIRNQNRSNLQYSFTSDKKRVGVYGIKGWISNN